MAQDNYISRDQFSELLDAIGGTPGAILVRGPDRWVALPPGNIGDVLIINDGGMPEWVDPTTVPFS